MDHQNFLADHRLATVAVQNITVQKNSEIRPHPALYIASGCCGNCLQNNWLYEINKHSISYSYHQ
jgi:hypothetical protein